MLDLVSQLQQRFKHTVVLMIVSDERVVDVVGQVSVGEIVSADVLFVTDHGIAQHARLLRFNQHTRVAEISNPDVIASVTNVRRRTFLSEKTAKYLIVFVSDLM